MSCLKQDYSIFTVFKRCKRHPEPEWLAERLSEGNFVQELYKAAVEDDVLICKIALDTFIEFLAREANNLTLKLKATGGLLISGIFLRKSGLILIKISSTKNSRSVIKWKKC